MLELPNPFGGEAGVIRLPESPEADRETLIRRVADHVSEAPLADGARRLTVTLDDL